MRYNFIDLPCITQLSSNFPIPPTHTHTHIQSHLPLFPTTKLPGSMFYFCLLHFGGFLTFAQVQRIGHNGLAKHIWYISLILYYCLKEYFFCFLFSKFFFYWNSFWFIINLITLWLQVREYILVVIVFSFISSCLFFHCCPIIFRQAYFVCSQIKLSILLFGLAAGVRHRPRSTWSPRHCRRRRLCSALLKGLFGVDGQAWTWTCGWESVFRLPKVLTLHIYIFV